jgi:spore coat protein U-like protein
MNTFLKNYLTKASYCLVTGLLMGTAYVGVASANTSTGSIAVTSNVVGSCTVAGAPFPFGAYSNTLIQTSVASGVSATCTNGESYTISFNNGIGTGASYTKRVLTGSFSGSTLAYELYKDSGYSQILGDGTNSTATITGTGNGSAQTYTIYGSMAASQGLTAGTYSDTVTVTITYS